MRKLTSIFVAFLLLVLSASYTEGQAVKIKPSKDGEMGTNRTYVDMNDRWVVCTDGAGILVYDRKMSLSDFPIPLWLDDGSVGINPQGVVDIILHGNFLIVAGDGYNGRGGIIGVWDLLNLSQNMIQKIGSKYYNPSGLYHPQNLRIDHRGLKRAFVNRSYNLIGIYDEDGLITVYEMFGNNTVLQEFYVGTDVLATAFSGDFVVLGKKAGVQLLQYNPSIQIYEDIGTIVSWDSAASPGSLEIRYADKGHLGIVTNNDAVFLIIGTRGGGIEIISLNKKTKKLISKKIIALESTREIYDIDGEFIAARGCIIHAPSAQVVGTFSLLLSGSATMNACCIYDSGSQFQMLTFGETSTDPQHWFYYFSEYDEPLFTVSTPKRIRRGTVQLLGSSRVFRGGSAVFAVTADPGKRVKYYIQEDSTKKIIRRETASLVLRMKKIKKNTGLKKVVFGKSNMEQYKVQLPNALIIGRPTPDEPNPKKWYYNLGVGGYVVFYTDSGGFFWFSIIKVKPGGRIATVPIFF